MPPDCTIRTIVGLSDWSPHNDVACDGKASGYYPEWTAFLQLADVRSMLRQRKHEFDDFLRTEFQDLPVHRIFQRRDQALVIASYASKHHVDLVMMPSHCGGTFRRLLLGSGTAKVLHDTVLPVWATPRSFVPRI